MTPDPMSADPAADVTTSIHDTGVVFFHARRGRLFTANTIGARIWHGLERRLSLEAIAADISREYGISQARGRQDTMQFVAQLERERLVERNGR